MVGRHLQRHARRFSGTTLLGTGIGAIFYELDVGQKMALLVAFDFKYIMAKTRDLFNQSSRTSHLDSVIFWINERH